jgi:hypothetical protein
MEGWGGRAGVEREVFERLPTQNVRLKPMRKLAVTAKSTREG